MSVRRLRIRAYVCAAPADSLSIRLRAGAACTNHINHRSGTAAKSAPRGFLLGTRMSSCSFRGRFFAAFFAAASPAAAARYAPAAAQVLDLAMKMKARPADYWDALKRRTLLMLFEKPSLRTRVSLVR